jgi:hydroxymethylglutaryl-CoA reductase
MAKKSTSSIILAGVLAGEFFLHGALASQHLARAYQQLERG